jgi:hypothetical protein
MRGPVHALNTLKHPAMLLGCGLLSWFPGHQTCTCCCSVSFFEFCLKTHFQRKRSLTN